MADVLDTITKLIQSPPGQLVSGGVLAGIVWKFFERVESVLNENTKLEVAVWLLGRKKLSPTFQNWPDTFAKVFDRVFGKKHLSWKCFGRSCMASFVSMLVLFVLDALFRPGLPVPVELSATYKPSIFSILAWTPKLIPPLLLTSIVANFLPDYFSLLETRWILKAMRSSTGMMWIVMLGADLLVTIVIALIAASVGLFMYSVVSVGRTFEISGKVLVFTFSHALIGPRGLWPPWWIRYLVSQNGILWIYPAFFTSIWLWLYVGSGFLLKAARRFDIGFDWFNPHFDIERKPLQSIGLVAGALVAVVYWAAVVVSRI